MALLDMYGNPIKKEALTKSEASHIISGVRDFGSNYPSTGLTPRKLSSLLRSADDGDPMAYLELAEEMEEKESQYLSVLGTRKRAVSQLYVNVKPAGGSAAEQAHADLVKEFFKRDVIYDELFDIMDAIGKGFSVCEIIWDCSEKQWFPRKIEYVDPRWFSFAPDKKTLLLKTENGLTPLSPFKYIRSFIKAKSGIPIRSGLARAVSWLYLFKNFDIKSWVTFLEVYGQPIRVGKYGSNATEEDKEKLLKAVYKISSDTAAIIPESMLIEFIKADQGASADLYERFATYADLAISKVVLGQTTTTDAVSGGHAVSKEHNEVRKDIMWSDARALEAILQRDIIKPLIDLNFGAQKSYPNIFIGNEEKEDITALTDCLSKLIPVGLKVSASQVLSKIGLDAPKDRSDVLALPQNQFEMPDLALNQRNESLNPVGDVSVSLQAGDQLQTGDDEWEKIETPLIEPIIKALETCSTYDEMLEKLLELYSDLDTDALTDMLSKALFEAHTKGRLSGKI